MEILSNSFIPELYSIILEYVPICKCVCHKQTNVLGCDILICGDHESCTDCGNINCTGKQNDSCWSNATTCCKFCAGKCEVCEYPDEFYCFVSCLGTCTRCKEESCINCRTECEYCPASFCANCDLGFRCVLCEQIFCNDHAITKRGKRYCLTCDPPMSKSSRKRKH